MTDKNKENEFDPNSENDSKDKLESDSNSDSDNSQELTPLNQSDENNPEIPPDESKDDLQNDELVNEEISDEQEVEGIDEVADSEKIETENSTSDTESSDEVSSNDEIKETDYEETDQVEIRDESTENLSDDEVFEVSENAESETDESPDELVSSEEEIKEATENPQHAKIEDLETEKFPSSNYKISLVGENEISVIVNTNRSVEIESSSKDKDSPINQKLLISKGIDNDNREIEIRINILEDSETDTSQLSDSYPHSLSNGKSRPQISLISENELSIKIITNLSVEIGSSSKKMDTPLNQNLVISKARDESKREIEIRIKILADEMDIASIPVQPGVLIPNPEVADLIVSEHKDRSEMTIEEILSLKIGKNSPHQKLRQVYEKNLKVGTVGAIIIYLIAIIAFAAYGKSKSNPTSQDVITRLVVLEDTPARVNLENLEDPGRPPAEEMDEADSKEEGIVPRRIPLRRTPIRPRTNRDFSRDLSTVDTTGIDTAALTGLDTIGGGDTASGKDLDGMEREFAENEIGLKFNYPDSWNVISISEIDKNKEGFEGVVIADTTLQPGNLNIFITVDNQEVEFSRTKFEDEFEMLTEDVMAFKSRPFFAGDDATYEYYMFFPEHKLHVRVSIKEVFYEKMKDVIDQSIKTINIQKPNSTVNTPG